MQFQAVFHLEATDITEAEQTVGEWTVSAGTVLQSLVGIPDFSTLAPLLVSDGGAVASGRTPTVEDMPPPPDATPATGAEPS